MSLDFDALEQFTVDGFWKCNYDTVAAVTVLPLGFGEGGPSLGIRMVTASGEIIADNGELKLTTKDEYSQVRQIKGKLNKVRKLF